VVNPTFILGPTVTTEVRSSLQLTKMMLDGRMPRRVRQCYKPASALTKWQPAGVNLTGLLLTVVGYSTHSPGLHLGWLLLDRLARRSVDPLLMQQARP
jgi:hypothetical protein